MYFQETKERPKKVTELQLSSIPDTMTTSSYKAFSLLKKKIIEQLLRCQRENSEII